MLPLRIRFGMRRGGVSLRLAASEERTADRGRASRWLAPSAALFASLCASLALVFMPSPVARAADDAGAALAAVPKPIDLDGLFEKLKDAPDAASAAFTAHAIEQRWARSGSDTADLLMQRANAALGAGDRPLAIEIIDRVIFLEPNWAEGWNRRATIFFLEEDFSRSVADIEEVLRREPRHYGALMGLAGILERIGDDRKALRTYQRVLEIYPTLANAQKGADRLKSRLGETAL
jgi:tetratricopeptide (TPR) repeat protein